MEEKMMNQVVAPAVGGPQTEPLGPGKYTPVDATFPMTNNPYTVGPDGAMYCVDASKPQFSQIPGNANNAIPTPSSIVQMPPIVQPIALVPYTSQNQPLLQYDPYSRPVDPQVQPKEPTYVKKPYRGISIASFVVALVALCLWLAAGLVYMKGIAADLSGIALLQTIIAIFTKDTSNAYYNLYIAGVKGDDIASLVVAYAMPILAVIVAVLFLVLAIKYITKISQGKSPRGFSVVALLNVIFIIAIAVCAYVLASAQTEADDLLTNFITLSGKAPVGITIALIVDLVLSIVLLIIPFFAKKNAYILDREDPYLAKKPYIINN